MNYLLTFIILTTYSLASFADDLWVSANSSKFDLKQEQSNAQPNIFNIVPSTSPGTLYFSTEFRASDDLVNFTASGIPEETLSSLNLTSSDVLANNRISLEAIRMGFHAIRDKLTSAQKKAWMVVHNNRKDIFEISFRLDTFYKTLDFEVLSGVGEGGETRAHCFSGLDQKVELEIVSLKNITKPSLNPLIKDVSGTQYINSDMNGFGPRRSLLPALISGTRSESFEYIEQCKALKD